MNGTLDCRCCRRKRSCIHKCVCLWYLPQEDLLEISELCARRVETKVVKNSIEKTSPFPYNFNQHPLMKFILEVVLAICKYLHGEKCIPLRDANSRTPHPLTCMKFVPCETTCNYCSVPLSVVIKITNKAMVVTLNKVVETYKRCEKCSMCFRYQEIERDVHNSTTSSL